MRFRACAFSASILVVLSLASAQNTFYGSVTGQVIDASTQHPLEFVNVVLYRSADSSMVKGTTTDKTGKFILQDVPSGDYYCTIFLIGYKQHSTKPIPLDLEHQHANLGKVSLQETSVTLDEVLVTREKAMQNNAIDRKVYNVEQDLMAKAGSASDLLQNVPSVQVDIDGNVSLRGSPDVLILVNGKNSPLMGTNRAEVLQQMPASTIDRIEVITNPSAKYKPDGTSGIINIVLKKNESLGVNGTVIGNLGNQGRYNGSLRLNGKTGSLNLYGGYSFRKDSRNRFNTDSRINADTALAYFRQELGSFADPVSHMANLGFDWDVSEATSAGANVHYFHNAFTRTDFAQDVIQDLHHIPTQHYDRNRVDPEFQEDFGATAHIEHKFENEEHNLRAEYSFTGHPETENNTYTNLYWLPPALTQYDATLIHPMEIEHQISVDYANPLSGTSTLEAGYAGEMNHGDYQYTANNFNLASQEWEIDPGRTNRFIVDQSIHAFYATLKQSFGKLAVLGGLRGEYARTTSDQVTQNVQLSHTYWNFYPTLHLALGLNETAELQLNYSRRVHRPGTEDLNPFPEYRDPRNVQAGNPLLLPEFIHSVECGVKLQNEIVSIIPSLFYRATSNRFSSVVTQLNDTTLLTTRENLSRDRSAGVELILSSNLGEVFSANVSMDTYYDQIDASNLGYGSKKSVVTWSGTLTTSLRPILGTMFQVNANYNSTRLTPQGEYRPTFVVNMGARQDLLENALSVTLTVADVFHTLKRELSLNTPILDQTVINKRDAGIVYLGLSWRFGTQTKKSKDEELKYDNGL